MKHRRRYTKGLAVLLSLMLLFSSMGSTAFAMGKAHLPEVEVPEELLDSENLTVSGGTIAPVKPMTPEEGTVSGNSAGKQEEEMFFPEEVCRIVSFTGLSEEIVRQEVPAGTALESITLPEQLEAKDTEGNTVGVPVTWQCNPEFSSQTVGEYIFFPILEKGYAITEGTEIPTVTIVLLENPLLMMADGSNYYVSDEQTFLTAVNEIQKGSEKEYTIVLQGDITLNTVDFTGVQDKKVTVKSEEGNQYYLSLRQKILKLSGSLVFENIRISPKTIYANGFELVLGDGFGGGQDGLQRMIVFGGSDGDLNSDTNVTVLDGVYKLVAGGNSSGTLTGDTYVTFGGKAVFPTAADLIDEGDAKFPERTEHYNRYFDCEIEVSSGPVLETTVVLGYLPYGIYGGGINGNVNGNTHIVMNGGNVYQIFGGGALRTPPSKTGNDLGQVSGDTHVLVTAGEVKSVYGGGYNDISACDEEGEAKESYRDTRAAVKGTANVTITGTAHVPAAERVQWNTTTSHDIPAVYGGSFHSSVGNTSVVIGGNALLESVVGNDGYGMVFGGGCNDKVFGTTYVELKDNARIGNDQNQQIHIGRPKGGIITPLGRSNSSRCYLGGIEYSYGADILNQNQSDGCAAVARVSGGTADILMAAHKQDPNVEKATDVNGAIQLIQSGGNLQTIEAGCRSGQKVNIQGNVDVIVSGGSTANYVMGRFPSGGNNITGNVTLTFEPCGTEKDYLIVPNIVSFDSVTVNKDAHIAIYPKYSYYTLIRMTPFTMVKDLCVEKDGYLALRDNGTIEGNLVVNGALHLGYKGIVLGDKEIGAKPRTLTAAGTAAGTGKLKTIFLPESGNDYSQPRTPKQNDACVYAKAEGSDMLLDLTNPEEELGVGRKKEKQDQDVWYITEQVKVTYQWKGGDRTNHLPKDAVLPGPVMIEKGSAFTAERVSSKTHTFDGWYLDEAYTQKFTDGTILEQDTTLYGNWRIGTDSILWYANVYIQKEDGSYPENPSLHGQRGWSAPNVEVSISHASFDGREVEQLILGEDVIYDGNCEKERLTATALEASKHNPLRIYYKRPYTVTYVYEGTVPQGAPEVPQKLYTYAGADVKIADTMTMDDYRFSGWSVKSPDGVSIQNGHLIMPSEHVVLTGTWSKIASPVEPKSAVYKVEHYQQQADGSYKLSDTEFPLYDEIGKTVTASPKAYAGYSVNNEKSVTSGIVVRPTVENGQVKYLVLTVFYDQEKVPVVPEPEKKTGNLTISKIVSGKNGETERDFHFTVTLSDTAVNGKYGDLEFVNGETAFTLRHGESKTVTGIPVGTDYVVAESSYDGYTVIKSGDTGRIEADVTAAVIFHNCRNSADEENHDDDRPVVLPDEGKPSAPSGSLSESGKAPVTGDHTDFVFQIVLMGSALATIALSAAILRKKARNKH